MNRPGPLRPAGAGGVTSVGLRPPSVTPPAPNEINLTQHDQPVAY